MFEKYIAETTRNTAKLIETGRETAVKMANRQIELFQTLTDRAIKQQMETISTLTSTTIQQATETGAMMREMVVRGLSAPSAN
jgi:competence protein ComGC